MKPQPKNTKQLDILEQQTQIQKISAELELFIVNATGLNISAMMAKVPKIKANQDDNVADMMKKVNGNIPFKDHLDIQRTLDLAKKTAGIVPYYPTMQTGKTEEKPQRKVIFEVIEPIDKSKTN